MNIYEENTYSLSQLENEVLDKKSRPMALIIGKQTFEVSRWTELSIKFVDWLLKKKN